MELHHRIELVNTLVEEADHKMQALRHALAAKGLTQEASQHLEDETLKYEQTLWEMACTKLTELRTVLEDIEESERQRGLSQ
jgi:hypothetical protein